MAFSRFRVYLSMEAPRSRTESAEELGLNYHTFNTMARKYKWLERARAYDDRMASRCAEAAMSAAEDMERRHLDAVRSMLSCGRSAIENALLVDPRDGVPMIDKGVRLERLIVGQATERTESHMSEIDRPPDLSKLTPEENAEYRELRELDTTRRWMALFDKARGRGIESL